MPTEATAEFMGHRRGANVGEAGADQDTVVAFACIDDGTPQLAMSCTRWRTGWRVAFAPSDTATGSQPNRCTGMAHALKTCLVYFLSDQFPIDPVMRFKVNSEHGGYFVMRYVNVSTDVNTR